MICTVRHIEVQIRLTALLDQERFVYLFILYWNCRVKSKDEFKISAPVSLYFSMSVLKRYYEFLYL